MTCYVLRCFQSERDPEIHLDMLRTLVESGGIWSTCWVFSKYEKTHLFIHFHFFLEHFELIGIPHIMATFQRHKPRFWIPWVLASKWSRACRARVEAVGAFFNGDGCTQKGQTNDPALSGQARRASRPSTSLPFPRSSWESLTGTRNERARACNRKGCVVGHVRHHFGRRSVHEGAVGGDWTRTGFVRHHCFSAW